MPMVRLVRHYQGKAEPNKHRVAGRLAMPFHQGRPVAWQGRAKPSKGGRLFCGRALPKLACRVARPY